MLTGDIILIPFPFAESHNVKVRPAVIIGFTHDKYKDIILSAISSIVPFQLKDTEIIIKAGAINNLRADSILKVDRIVTLKKENIIAEIGKLNKLELTQFKEIFKSLID